VLGQAGANGLGAFEAQTGILLIALASFQKKRRWRYALYGLGAFSTVCLMYSFSRGAYLAFVAGCMFVGIVRLRKLLVLLLVLGLAWASLVPPAVQDRISGTETADGGLDHSSEIRLTLWEDALNLASQNMLFGTGYNTYIFMQRVTGYFGSYWDTHNIYLKVLVETGVVGLLLFFCVMGKTYLAGYRLFRYAEDPFLASIGLGLAVWVICSAVANLFGDRWTYLQVNGFMWVLGGLVTRGIMMEDAGDSTASDEEPGEADEVPVFDIVPANSGMLHQPVR
jgi:O-antigen ligase